MKVILMSIFFITGTSGSGKSTLINYLKERLLRYNIQVHDFDEVGVPSNADQAWRRSATDYWLQKAKTNLELGKPTLICGVVVPSEVLASSVKLQQPIYFGFIKIDEATIRRRLLSRNWDEPLIQDNINWAHYLENDVHNQQRKLLVDGVNEPEKIADIFTQWILDCIEVYRNT